MQTIVNRNKEHVLVKERKIAPLKGNNIVLPTIHQLHHRSTIDDAERPNMCWQRRFKEAHRTGWVVRKIAILVHVFQLNWNEFI